MKLSTSGWHRKENTGHTNIQEETIHLGKWTCCIPDPARDLGALLETSTYLLDRLTRQFHVVYNDGYRKIATTPMLLSTWHKGQLIDELEETSTLFGLPPKEAHHLKDNLQQVSTYHQQSSREARVMPRTQQRMMKLYQI